MVLKHGDKNFMKKILVQKKKLAGVDLSTVSNSSYEVSNERKGVSDDISNDSLILYSTIQMIWHDYQSNLKETECLTFLSKIASQE
jgi:hypothetical protein